MKKVYALLFALILFVPFVVEAKSNKIKEVKEKIFEALEIDTNYITISDNFKKIDAGLDEYNFEFDDDNFRYVIIKQATYMIIWTEKELKEEVKPEFIFKLKNASKDNSLKDSYFENPTYIFGEGKFDLTKVQKQFGVYEFVLNEDGTVSLFTNASKISHADFGTYEDLSIVPEEPEEETILVWEKNPVSVGHDSATGYAINEYAENYDASLSNNWFLGQNLDFSNTSSIALKVQAGNPKNGTHFVGDITLGKAGNKYTINYETPGLPSVEEHKAGDTVVLSELSGAKYGVYGEATKYQAPGHLPKDLTNGTTFDYDNDVFSINMHFDVDYYEYTLVEKAI